MNPPDEELFALASDDAGEESAAGAKEPGAGPGPEPAPKAGLKKRVIPDPPEIDQAKGRQTLAFLIVLALAACVAMAAVGTFNTLADPYGTIGMRLLPSATTTDRTVKADLIAALRRPPQLIVLGSSRSMTYEPAYLKRKTGLRTFNAGLNGIGGTADSWAIVNFIHERFPASRPAYFWLVDVESFVPFSVQGRTAAEPRLARYIDETSASRSVSSVLTKVYRDRATVFSWTTAGESWRVLTQRKQAAQTTSSYRKRFRPDGTYIPRGKTATVFKKYFLPSVQRYRDLYTNAYHGLDPRAKAYFERTLAFVNIHGATPLIVLTPINPKTLKVIGPLGWYTRHRQVVDYLKSLQADHRFVFIDLTAIATFNGDPEQFTDGVHMSTVNTRRAIDYVLRKTGGIPK